MDDEELFEHALSLGRALKMQGYSVVTAESCTGGWIGKVLTDVPGSSSWLYGGFITYSNEAKVRLLGVFPQTLEAFGAVSEAVVRAMAEGALAQSEADFSIAVTGVAGPDGGTPDKPVGLVWFAWARSGGETVCESRHFPGDRDAVRRSAVWYALEGLRPRIIED